MQLLPKPPTVQFLIDNFILIAVAVVSGTMLFLPMLRQRTGGAVLTTLQATQLINSRHAQIVDLRAADEFAKGSLPNARNVPSESVGTRAGEFKKDKPLLLVCATGGPRARKAAAQLRSQGFGEVFILGGGLAAWREAGLPLRT